MNLEKYFEKYRKGTIGTKQKFKTPFGEKRIVYSDWTASGRLYKQIEDILLEDIAPFVGNTHTETTVTGSSMTQAYSKAKKIIKKHVNADFSDVIISSNSGMTGVVNKLQRILGLKVHEKYMDVVMKQYSERPIVFVSHMEHHSNQTSWMETRADVEIIPADKDGLFDINNLKNLVEKYKDRKVKIAAITSCSNVTGIMTPYHEIAKIMHQNDGLIFVDFAASAPYIDINMRPENPLEHLDAIFFSPHKFLGGPGGTGILLFDPKLYTNKIPDNPGGGTVDWTNPWGEHKYLEHIEAREDGGTPAFLQTMKVALAIKLKEEMGVKNILAREHELLKILWKGLEEVKDIHILADQHKDRLGIISFYIENLHFNLAVKLLNDRYGIQMRGGCSCAGTYGHYLLEVSYERSRSITEQINMGILTSKPGWIRMSIHPIMTDSEVKYITNALKELSLNHKEWGKDYDYDIQTNEFTHKSGMNTEKDLVKKWFVKELS